ncbi:MAG: SAM-dependent methyltransferase [Confluentimicrobium sp.]|jgi:SAM-dependent methyltransferase|uniref:class I SAM-dependent methyltransferase n=1 Tax=Actibacterium sp. TaxID=1872125 RepID=UPI00050D9571|nr:methyltransferase domain-containing protein [Actibacterium sp.]KGB80922.1 methyltransferase [Rhodovulum sp. NI22]MBC58416.1 SAM-dependent methyltransferase [Actibacterium sp.]MDY6858928.1 methyltransferase domain-containing protein [Pseudomonadota bacterium]|tara:strand:+ start:1937 stop:2716 length:780 start_codon:yes stop_codon:yes gene_type:complete
MTPLARIEKLVRDTATVLLPEDLRKWVRKQQRLYKLQSVPVGKVDFGGLRRLSPISTVFGQDRDLLTIERYYIEQFLEKHAADVKGRCLEMGDPAYINKFGGDKVTQADVLNYVEGNPHATIVADLTDAPHIPDDTFDCIIITQTLQMIYEVDKAIATLHRILKPGGVVLCTSHGMTRVARREGVDDWGEYWHFTTQSKRRLFGDVFGRENTEVSTVGNIFTCICNLHGLGAGEIDQAELDVHDPNYEMLVLVRAVKQV